MAESSGKESLLDGGSFAGRSCASGNKADGSSMAMSWVAKLLGEE